MIRNGRIYEFLCLIILISGNIACNISPGSESKNIVLENITIINSDKFSEIISKRNAKSLFVNIWATWCIPCIEEFPDLIKLNKKYNKKDVDIITLNINLLSEKNSKVIPFLKKQGNSMMVLMAENDEIDNLINLLDKDWTGAVPVTYVFNNKGQLFSSVLGKKDYNYYSLLIDSVLSTDQKIN